MKKIAFLTLLLFSAVFDTSAQVKEAKLLQKFGNTNCDDYGAKLDTLLAELHYSPDSKGYVLVYEGNVLLAISDKNIKSVTFKYVSPEVSAAKELISFFKKHLQFRNFPRERINFVEAGFREKFVVELWVVPSGLAPPKPAPTLQRIKHRRHKPKPYGFCGEM